MARKRRFSQTSLTKNISVPDAVKRSTLQNALLRQKGDLGHNYTRALFMIDPCGCYVFKDGHIKDS